MPDQFALGIASAHACDDPKHAKRADHAGSKQRSALVTGEVREVDPEGATITLSHAKIASLQMAPMASMVFKAVDPAALRDFKPGDKVRFRAAMVDAQPSVVEIRRAGK